MLCDNLLRDPKRNDKNLADRFHCLMDKNAVIVKARYQLVVLVCLWFDGFE